MLEKKGVLIRYINVIEGIDNGEVTSVRIIGSSTSEFQVAIGLHYGSALSPYLFTLFKTISLVHVVYGSYNLVDEAKDEG